MGEFKLEWPDSSPCLNCGVEVDLAVDNCPDCNEDAYYRFTTDVLLLGFTTGRLIDARRGGLVLGRAGIEDDIPLCRAIVPGVMDVCARMHGGEFILNNQASFDSAERLAEINSYKDPDYVPLTVIPLTATTRVFNTNGLDGPDSNPCLLIQTGQFIVNRAATAKYYSELEQINNASSPKLG